MEQKRTVEELVAEINALAPIEKLLVQQRLKENTVSKPVITDKSSATPGPACLCEDEADEMLWAINESKYYTTIAKPQIHDPLRLQANREKSCLNVTSHRTRI